MVRSWASVMTSDDGIHWELELVPDSLTNAVFLGIGGLANRYVVVGNKGNAMTSANGVVWDRVTLPHTTKGPTVHQHFGRLFGTRSGDKGGNANLGVWARTLEEYAFLRSFLSVAKLKTLLPDLESYRIDRYELHNLYALNFYVRGILGDGVAASVRLDPQAKTLGEYLRAKMIDIPVTLI